MSYQYWYDAYAICEDHGKLCQAKSDNETHYEFTIDWVDGSP